MKNNQKHLVNNYEKPFESQEQLRNAIVDKFAKHGNKVKYQVKVTLK